MSPLWFLWVCGSWVRSRRGRCCSDRVHMNTDTKLVSLRHLKSWTCCNKTQLQLLYTSSPNYLYLLQMWNIFPFKELNCNWMFTDDAHTYIWREHYWLKESTASCETWIQNHVVSKSKYEEECILPEEDPPVKKFCSCWRECNRIDGIPEISRNPQFTFFCRFNSGLKSI